MNAETTPTLAEEFELTQAGLGKRNLTMSKDMTHAEFFRQLQDVYPKMDGLTGGWLLKKATGGHGKRKLVIVPPDSEGYTGSLIRSASTSGKNLLYVVPLQQELDLTPLPADASEFQSMPKVTCQTCKLSFPLQILALHIQGCMESQSEDDREVPCPICFSDFPSNFLEVHASTCGDRAKEDFEESEIGVVSQKGEEEHIKCVDDVLSAISGSVDTETYFRINISRTNILERGLLQWQRQKKVSPTATLKVTFFGEAGNDTGALRKEFLTGGPAPGDWSYSYLCSGKMDQKAVNKEDVGDTQFKLLIDRVESSTDDTILELADEILSCGYTGVVSNENKESIIRAITLHAVLRLQPMLEQLREGMQLYGLLSIMKQYPEICRPLFVPEGVTKVSKY
ncbi:hypothetical protein DPEC_G00342330 [Dallia pectoralis]|uniref:Uncharacterized protein n=1 Tax=Dallia pectoralis TaxID=75939 RepID=A0ACC2F5Q5_DALPE|nr:hypothetical protein DPEC_G00342330 [Dallia pectoralis]